MNPLAAPHHSSETHKWSEELCVANHFVLVELVAAEVLLCCMAVGSKSPLSSSRLKVLE